MLAATGAGVGVALGAVVTEAGVRATFFDGAGVEADAVVLLLFTDGAGVREAAATEAPEEGFFDDLPVGAGVAEVGALVATEAVVLDDFADGVGVVATVPVVEAVVILVVGSGVEVAAAVFACLADGGGVADVAATDEVLTPVLNVFTIGVGVGAGVGGGAAATALDFAILGSGVDGAGVGVEALAMTFTAGTGAVPAGGSGKIFENLDSAPAGGTPKTGVSTCGPAITGGGAAG